MDETMSSKITSIDNSATGREVFYDLDTHRLWAHIGTCLLDPLFIMIGCSDHGGDVFQL